MLSFFRKRKVRPDVLSAAVELFGLHSFRGVTVKELAKTTGIAEWLIYRRYGTIKALYVSALRHVTSGLNNHYLKFVLKLVGVEQDPMRLVVAMRNWYLTLDRSSARLLLRVFVFGGPKQHIVNNSFSPYISALANALGGIRRATRANCNVNTETDSRILFAILLQKRAVDDASVQQVDEYLKDMLPMMGLRAYQRVKQVEHNRL